MVVGAGVSGLTAGALLARGGLSVCVVERQPRVGGYIAGFERKGFHFDTAIHWLNQCGPGGFVHKVFGHLGPDSPRAPPLTRIRRYKSDSFDFLLTASPDVLAADLASAFPRDAGAITRFFREARILGERLRSYAALMRTPESMTFAERLRRNLVMARWGLPWLKYLGVAAEDGLARRFTSPALRAIFASEESLLSVLVPIGWAYTGDYQAAPAGGAQAFARWLCGVLIATGGSLVVGSGVEQVLVAGGRATGVQLASGETIKARYVIAAMDVETLYERLLPRGTVPGSLIAKLRAAELYPSAVTVALGLDVPADRLGLSEELVYLTRAGLTRRDHNGPDPDKVGLSVLSPSLRDPSQAPPGKGTLLVYAPAHMRDASFWHTGPGLERGIQYRTFKQAYADKLLDRLEQTLIPGLRGHIEVCSVATPVTHHRYTGNRDGTIMGATPSRANVRSHIAGNRTPVKNLLLAGHWAEYGGGIPIAVKAAANAALLVLREARPDAFAILCRVLDAPVGA